MLQCTGCQRHFVKADCPVHGPRKPQEDQLLRIKDTFTGPVRDDLGRSGCNGGDS